MKSAPTVVLTLEIGVDDDPIHGTCTIAGERREFTGWIDLVALIDQAARAQPVPAEDG